MIIFNSQMGFYGRSTMRLTLQMVNLKVQERNDMPNMQMMSDRVKI